MKTRDNNTEDILAVIHQPCPSCEARAMEWIKQYYESFCGPNREWSEEQWDKFHRELGLLIAFTKDTKLDP